MEGSFYRLSQREAVIYALITEETHIVWLKFTKIVFVFIVYSRFFSDCSQKCGLFIDKRTTNMYNLINKAIS